MSLEDDKNTVVDQSTRRELLDPSVSFIVQAPAGSGKTELLTQRILALLTRVEKPENILAITFTRKAAAEMQSRVVSALMLAKEPEPDAAHERERWLLARRVIDRDQLMGWHLLENASRLNITTIDSLSASLSGALPLLSQTGALPKIAENANPYYRQAAEDLLQSVSDGDQVAEQILTLLRHKDNNLNQVTELLSQMLAKRLQWMATIRSHAKEFDQSILLGSLQQLIEEKLALIYELMPTDIISELPTLLNQASTVLRKQGKGSKLILQELAEVAAIAPPTFQDLNLWQAISELLLKAGNKPELLSSFTVASGFPTEKDAVDEAQKIQFRRNKMRVQEIASQLAAMDEIPSLLLQIKLLPASIETSVSQQSLRAAVALLPLAVAHLKLVFSRYNVIDFSELALTSLEALGHEDMPSDLALALDYKLEHILIDEFQDTSTPQVELIKLLTAGWDDSSERTLFLVGDPMQSIYRFRDANVSLFMQIREQGLGHIQLAFRRLQVNFRSNGVIVEWVNQQFSRIMPDKEDFTFAAVNYAPSVAFNAANPSASVNCWLTVDASDNMAQAEKVIELVETHLTSNRDKNEKKTLAILARSRAHLSEIIQLLNRAKIDFQAVDIDRLSQKMVVSDLLSLAYALCDQYDELSWASCMRSPWFGLKLNDIRVALVQGDASLPMPLRIASAQEKMSAESRQRCEKILPILNAAMVQKGRKPFRKWLYGCFMAVGGLAALELESDRDDLMVCLDKLAELQEGGELNDRQIVNDAIAQLFAAPNPKADGQVQVMTVHKSKGLEFDTVILPRLDSMSRSGEQVLLKWSEVLDRSGEPHNLLAISKQTGEENDSVYQYISFLENEKSKFENHRVLYVAATRTRQHLHLLGNVNSDAKSDGYKTPVANSFLAMLWEGVKERFNVIAEPPALARLATDSPGNDEIVREMPLFQSRQVKQVNLAQVAQIPRKIVTLADTSVAEQLPFSEQEWHTATNENEIRPYVESASAIGTVLHQQLQWISQHYRTNFKLPENWAAITRGQLVAIYQFESEAQLIDAVQHVITGVNNTLNDEFGRFLLQAHLQAASELVLHKKIDSGSFLTRIIDRTFIKDEVRWIIDYKSSRPLKDEPINEFLTREKKLYLEQLSDYFKMFAKLEKRKIIAGLYFPMLAHFERVLEN